MLRAIGIPDEPREKLSPKAVMEESASPMLEVDNRTHVQLYEQPVFVSAKKATEMASAYRRWPIRPSVERA
jgi:hypothetical protein